MSWAIPIIQYLESVLKPAKYMMSSFSYRNHVSLNLEILEDTPDCSAQAFTTVVLQIFCDYQKLITKFHLHIHMF